MERRVIIDDYGHHPVEIAAVLKAARESTKGQVIAVVQPHRYTRLQSLFEPFSHLLQRCRCGDPGRSLSGREAPIEGIDRDQPGRGDCARAATGMSIPLDRPEQLAGIVKGLAKPGDFVVCLGAG